jgi:G-protein signaling modulator 2
MDPRTPPPLPPEGTRTSASISSTVGSSTVSLSPPSGSGSVSASVALGTPIEDGSGGDNDACLQLALEGEKLCKGGNCRDGVAFFEAALQAGTDDFRTLSAIYSQLGNAYFYMGDYVKAMQYHKHDLTLARTMGDRLGEAKASGNLGNTLKVMGKFEEAVICCRRHLEICQEHGDRVGEGRALYNLGNVYHAKGKHIGRLGHQDPGEFPDEVKALFEKAVHYYEENMMLMKEIADRAAQGRACGNLGNVHYLLGNFSKAIHFHHERLKIAKEFGDRAAERRAHSNLGNAHIFLGEFEMAADHYKKTLRLAQELEDRAVEAQACYSLGNTYTLLKDYNSAIDYHLKHLAIAQELLDKVGEGRACWSLGNAHSALGQHHEAYQYAARHLGISKSTGDRMGQATAQLNIAELAKALGQHMEVGNFAPQKPSSSSFLPNRGTATASSIVDPASRRLSMEKMDLLKMTPNARVRPVVEAPGVAAAAAPSSPGGGTNGAANKSGLLDEEDFFDFVTRFQSKRMDDQRCSMSSAPVSSAASSVAAASLDEPGGARKTGQAHNADTESDNLLDMIAGVQGHRMDEQRAAAATLLPGLSAGGQPTPTQVVQRLSVAAATNNDQDFPDDSFFEVLMKCQGTRIEDQRSSLPFDEGVAACIDRLPAPTVPDEDFFSLIQRIQGGRLEDQRANFPLHPPKHK